MIGPEFAFSWSLNVRSASPIMPLTSVGLWRTWDGGTMTLLAGFRQNPESRKNYTTLISSL